LTLREALGLQVAIPLKQRSTFDAIPALGAIIIVTLLVMDYCSHSYLLLKPLSWEKCMAKDDGVALLLQPLTMSSDDCLGPSSRSSGRRGDQGRMLNLQILTSGGFR